LSTLVLGAAVLVLSVGAGTAGAIVTQVGGHRFGVTPINGVNAEGLRGAYQPPGSAGSALGPRNFDTAPGGGGPLLYHGGAVMHSVTTHLVYWDPSGTEFSTTTTGIFKKFFTDLSHDSGLGTNSFAVAGQYEDGTGNAAYSSTFGTEGTDTTAYPTSECIPPTTPIGEVDLGPYTNCLTDVQLRTELLAYIGAHTLPKGSAQMYFLLLPHKVDTCFAATTECSNNVFCAYHTSVNPGPNEIIYAVVPFSLLDSEWAKGCQFDGHSVVQQPNPDTPAANATGYADVALKYTSHEYTEAATDPLGNAYFDEHGLENGDKCNAKGTGRGADPNAFLPTLSGSASLGTLFDQSINAHSYYLQSEWDNTAKACLMKPATPTGVGFTVSPASVPLGASTEFKGAASDIYGGPVYTWNWGDGTESTGVTPSHVYGAAGTFGVTMTVTDQFTGASAKTTGTFVVTEPPPPPPPVVVAAVASAASPPSTIFSQPPPPNSAFSAPGATFNATTGVITFTASVTDPGKLSWLLTFQNGKFGVFAASVAKCKAGFVRLGGRCRPSKIVFAKGSVAASSPGTVRFTVKPTTSALKALRNALKLKKGLPVTITLTFQSARGGSAVSHTQSLTVKLKKK
jgi:PKD repeat protein